MNIQSGINLIGLSRIHIGLAVTDIERATDFYRRLLDVEPSKVRSDYVKFDSSNPSVNLTLNQINNLERTRNGISHFGIEVKSAASVKEAIRRFGEAGFEIDQIEEDTICCYAIQDKVWLSDPDGNQWEVFVVKDNKAAERSCDADQGCAALG